MTRPTPRQLAACLAALAIGALACAPAGPVSVFAGWVALFLFPGLAAYALAERHRRVATGWALYAFAFSPVMVAILSVVGILAGAEPVAIGRTIALGAGVVTALSCLRPASLGIERRELTWLVSLILLTLLLCATLPFTHEWWRIRSDAWFHAAVVAEIADAGLPPQDPYFLGMPLQYMWFYHALVLTASRTLGIDAFWGMVLVNVNAVVALALAAWHLAGVFRARTAHRLWATATVLFGFNAAFWLLLPVKFVKAAIGDVRGLEEVKRTFQLFPLHYDRAYGFMNIYFNQEFFLDKYMVATAFGIALVFLITAWYAATEYLRAPRASLLVTLALSLVGMLGFHSLVGFVTLVGLFGGAFLMHLTRRSVDGYSLRPVIVLLSVSLACFLATTPYLYSVMHMKERAQVFPLSVSFAKTAGILISSAFVILLAWMGRRFFLERTPAVRLFAFGTIAVTAFCLLITLPGPNTYDKLGYFVFIPLAIAGGLALADRVTARGAGAALLWVALFFLPVNVIAFVSCFGTPDGVEVTADEARLSEWVRANTPRNAVFIDNHDRTFLLVTGPRRYLWGNHAYAYQWGYPRLEMSRRFHARNALYSPSTSPLDATTLDVLAAVESPVYVLVRPEDRERAAALREPELLRAVHEENGWTILEVDRARCAERAASQTDRLSPEDLIRESGL